ncbi:transcriptional regulator [Streptomyces spiroverticillatus]|uniref:helix-turn-helix domain-containing protein n=1 Tax=Streptomyces finlayi TaxID=67296 RepID=UPI00199E8A57|nr:helix-turn-helix transcriptional regulator [Streptomyces finlayi]GHA20563.1 transcriptional regulator [Streptomyces spiroverticillatus]
MHSGERRGSKAFGALLRFHRELGGLSQEALGARIGYSKSQVAMVEKGERRPKRLFVLKAGDALGAQGALLAVAKVEFPDSPDDELPREPSSLDEYLAEEGEAASIRSYQNMVFPGLLQTEEYARAVHRSGSFPTPDDETVEQRVAQRMERKALIHRRPVPDLTFVLEESTLTRPLGGRACLKAQLHHVLDLSELRHVRIQVMPHDLRSHPGLMGCLILLETGDHRHLAYIEGPRTSRFITEQPDLGNLNGTYGVLQSQALTPDASAKLITKVAQEL